jgi:hypothetical protein
MKMDLSEFQAWFEGYTEEMKGVPTKEQWSKIKKRVKEITPEPTPMPVFVNRYVRPWREWWEHPYIARLESSIKSTATLADWRRAGSAEMLSTQ